MTEDVRQPCVFDHKHRAADQGVYVCNVLRPIQRRGASVKAREHVSAGRDEDRLFKQGNLGTANLVGACDLSQGQIRLPGVLVVGVREQAAWYSHPPRKVWPRRGALGAAALGGQFSQGKPNGFPVQRLTLTWLCGLLSESGEGGGGVHGENEERPGANNASEGVRANSAQKRKKSGRRVTIWWKSGATRSQSRKLVVENETYLHGITYDFETLDRKSVV